MVMSADTRRLELERRYLARLEQHRRAQADFKRVVLETARTGKITPEAVIAYAALFLRTDDGQVITPAAHHRAWIEILCDPYAHRVLIIAPPESAKTTWTLSAYVGLYLAVYPERSVIIGSTSGPIAEKRAMSLRATVESPEWRSVFPDVTQAHGLPYRTHEWSIAPKGIPHPGRLHPTVAAFGTGGPVIGARADLVIADDLLDFENSRTANSRAWVEQWMHRSLLSRRKARTGRAIVIGTAWHHADLYANLRQSGGWVVCHVPMLSDGPDVYATLTYPDNFRGRILGEQLAPTLERGP
jgi:hypothetical protein